MVDTIKDGDGALYADFDNRYLRRDARFGIERAAIKSIPVIDIAPFVRSGNRAAREAVGHELRAACVDSGFFYLKGHGIPQSEFDKLFEWGHRFFEQPLEEKAKLRRARSLTGQGYIGIGGTNPDANTTKAPDLKETFSMGRELVPGESEKGRFGAGQNQWPQAPSMRGFEPFLKSYILKCIAVAQALVRGLALSLGLEENYFGEMHKLPGCNLLYNYYPPLDRGKVDRTQWSISPHTDYGSFTLLAQDHNSGLYVRNSAGEWIGVPPVSGTFVVNIADLFARWTNDLYVSSLHRAANLNTEARISVPFFVFPHGMTEVSCLETCYSPGNPPRYESVLAQEYLQALLDQSDRTGRPGIAARTVERFRSQKAEANS
jgi:isopenicillin N synthase-like dioxygenase